MTVRVRVAPSPTGDPHVGTAYMSLFNLAFARREGGTFLLRIEDTDRARFQADSEQQVYDTLRWLGLGWDEGPDVGGPFAPYRQSERLETYRPVADALLAAGRAYHCWCTSQRLTQMREAQQKAKRAPGYDRLCLGKTQEERSALPGFQETPVVRMLIPADVALEFVDLIRGRVGAPRPDDQVLMKTDGFPTYHLANVVDDHEMGITHVVRGEEWIASTPKHILLYDCLGWDPPGFAHMPLLRNADKSKISKRKNPAARLTWFIDEGFMPEALRNFLGLMGYSLPAGQEIFSFEEMVASFDWSRVNPVGPVFDVDKLRWLSGHYIRGMDVVELAERLVRYMDVSGAQAALIARATPLVQPRMSTLREARDMLQFLVAGQSFAIDPDAAAKQFGDGAREVLAAALAAIGGLSEFDHAGIEAALRASLVDDLGLKPRNAFGPVRVALTGSTISPPLFESIELLGAEEAVLRLQAALSSL